MLELIQPFKESRSMILFRYGTAVIGATTWKSDFSWNGYTFLSEPAVEVQLPRQSGGLNQDPCIVELPLKREKVHPALFSMAAAVASSRALPKVQIEVMTLLVDGNDQRVIYQYEGTLERSRVNPDRKPGIVRMEFADELRLGLDRVSLGRRCDPECDAIFGGTGCGHPNGLGRTTYSLAMLWPNNAGEYQSAWVALSIDPDNARVVHVQLNPVNYPSATLEERQKTISEHEEGHWTGAYITCNSIKIAVQSWIPGNPFFTMARIPPASWDGAVGFLTVDCARTKEACTNRGWSDRFNGLGFGIPAYNPALESPNTG